MAEERRVVTVLFADVAGSTRLGEQLDPEDVRALMSRYYQTAQTVVSDHGGTLEKFIGDAIMAVFGLPRVHGDDAERAVAAAVALRDAIRTDPALSELRLRFGLATGEVVASRDVARGQMLVTGDAVNVAARLQQHADPWEIVATARTAFDTEGRFNFTEPRDVEVSGRTEPVAACTLIGAVEGPSTRRTSGFIGRQDEIDQLRLTARRAFRDRSPAVVSIVAPAGTGKTRLVEQFTTKVLPELAPSVRIEVAQCLPYGRQLTYWPLRSVLFSLASLSESASPAEIVDSLTAWLGDRREAELLAATVGAEGSTAQDPTELFAAWRSAFAKAALNEPLVIIFEDLHWSSDSLLDLVEFVMDPRETVAILTVAIARPELLDRRPSWGGGRRNFVSLYLDPLTEQDITAVVRPLMKDAPDSVVKEIVRRAEGNPFFAGELARASMEAGGSSLPDTVQATVLARLDLLGERQRRILQVASVFGRSFRPQGVKTLMPDVDGAMDELLDELVGRDLLRIQDAEHFAFRHILIRDVAYSTLPRVERGRLHAAAGEWYESRAAGREDELAEIVAIHFREAASNRGSAEVRAKAISWLRRAADSAIRAAATREAEAHIRAALELTSDGDEAAGLWIRLGNLLMILPGAYGAFDRAYRAATSPRLKLTAVNGLLMTTFRWASDAGHTPDEVITMKAGGEQLAGAVEDELLGAWYRCAVSFYPYWATNRQMPVAPDHKEASRGDGEYALQVAERLNDANLTSAALDGLTTQSMQRGDWEATRTLARRRQAIGDRLSRAEGMDADHMVTWSSFCLGEPAISLATAEAMGAKLRPGQLPDWRLSSMIWRLRALIVLGRWDEAVEQAHVALAQVQQIPSVAPGWLTQSFHLALWMARARQDAALATSLADAVRAASFSLSTTRRVRMVLAMLDEDYPMERDLAAAALAETFMVGTDLIWDLTDAGIWKIDDVQWMKQNLNHPIVPVEVQLRRATGLLTADRAELRRALDLARRSLDAPATARLSIELGQLSADPTLVDEGHAMLVAMRDLRQLDRYGLA